MDSKEHSPTSKSTLRLLVEIWLIPLAALVLLVTVLSSVPETVSWILGGSLSAVLGLVLIIWHTLIGSRLYEANRRTLSWLWRRLWKLDEAKIAKTFESGIYGIWYSKFLTLLVGVGFLLLSVMIVLAGTGIIAPPK